VNGKSYVGQTTGSLETRKHAHLREARDFPMKGRYFQWALREFAAKSFVWEILCTCESQEELDAREQEYILKFRTNDPDHGYNLDSGGGSGKSDGRLRSLVLARPRDVVLTQQRLDRLGISSNLASWYVSAGWLQRFGSRAFIRHGDQVDWRGGLYALQTQLGMTAHVGARTALELQGRAHFVPLGSTRLAILISDKREHLPAWFKNHPWEAEVKHHTLALFEELPADATAQLDCGGFRIAISSPERAIMEEMRLTRRDADIDYSIQLVENLSTLRPRLVQQLLERCTAIKVKRLFLWSAEHVGHAWVDQLDPTRVELGSGKRQLYKGGCLDPKYEITVPQQESLPDA